MTVKRSGVNASRLAVRARISPELRMLREATCPPRAAMAQPGARGDSRNSMQQDETAFYERIYRRADGAGRAAMLNAEIQYVSSEEPRERYYVAVKKDDANGLHGRYGEWLLSQNIGLPHQSALMGDVALVAAPNEATPKAQYVYLAEFLSELNQEGVGARLWSLPEEAMSGSIFPWSAAARSV
jgi:hypothetical protein